ncbi:hypothetical protein ACFU6M_32745 [Streptomyces bottropensis]|uniref:hypothetical protein n=1 Tax=Streptomyces bottropensis TaxID=42235 RepID=UPI0036929B8D
MPAPTHSGPVALARGFLTGGVPGVAPASLVVGVVSENLPLFVTGPGVPAVYGALLHLAGAPGRAREAVAVPHTALAMIESLRAASSESGDMGTRAAIFRWPPERSRGYARRMIYVFYI